MVKKELAAATWHGLGDTLEIQGFVIEDPMVYTIDSAEEARVDFVLPLHLDVTQSRMFDYDPQVFSYSDLSPEQRYAYLCWLAYHRNDSDSAYYEGYYHFYIYGLEYRVLHDNKDLEAIALELINLHRHNGSGYLEERGTNLLAIIIERLFTQGKASIAKKIFEVMEDFLRHSCVMSALKVYRLLDSNATMKAEDIINSLPFSYYFKGAVTRGKTGHLFISYMKFLANDALCEALDKGGYTITSSEYAPATNALIESYPHRDVFVEMGAQQQKNLVRLWHQAARDLRPYNRHVRKKPLEEIFHLLPDMLQRDLTHPLQDNVSLVREGLLAKPITFSELAAALGYSTTRQPSALKVEALIHLATLQRARYRTASLVFSTTLPTKRKHYRLPARHQARELATA